MCIHSPASAPPSRLPHNTEQSSMCFTVVPCWSSISNIEDKLMNHVEWFDWFSCRSVPTQVRGRMGWLALPSFFGLFSDAPQLWPLGLRPRPWGGHLRMSSSQGAIWGDVLFLSIVRGGCGQGLMAHPLELTLQSWPPIPGGESQGLMWSLQPEGMGKLSGLLSESRAER